MPGAWWVSVLYVVKSQDWEVCSTNFSGLESMHVNWAEIEERFFYEISKTSAQTEGESRKVIRMQLHNQEDFYKISHSWMALKPCPNSRLDTSQPCDFEQAPIHSEFHQQYKANLSVRCEDYLRNHNSHFGT